MKNFMCALLVISITIQSGCTRVTRTQSFGPQPSSEEEIKGPQAIEGMAVLGGLLLAIMAVGVLSRNASDAANS